jgi:hypothetical protein
MPAEIKNEIYNYTFDSEPRELLSIEAHPLSMLLTCHKVNYEATNLAFSRHTFPLSHCIQPAVFVSLRVAIAHLSRHQVGAITAVSFDQRRTYVQGGQVLRPSNIIANAMLVFPNLKRFDIRNLRSNKPPRSTHHNTHVERYAYQCAKVAAVQKYVPGWFTTVLESTIDGYAYAWHTGEHWRIDWPQLKDDGHLEIAQYYNHQGDLCYSPSMSARAVGVVRGVQTCPCSCEDVEWTSADLVQETGRTVAVNFAYYGPQERPLPDIGKEQLLRVRLGPKAVILRESAPRLDVIEGTDCNTDLGPSSFAYEATEEYWEDLRRRNGDVGALCRGWWRAATRGLCAESLPGSKSFGEGDWAKMKEVGEIPEVVEGDVANERSCAS